MRVSVQVRVPSRREGERWQRSVYVDETPRDLSVFLDDLRPIGPTSSWKANLSKADTLLLVVDTTNARPGAAGRVRFEDLRWGSIK